MKINPQLFLVIGILVICIISGVLIQLDKPALFIIESFAVFDTSNQPRYVLAYSLDGVVYQAAFDTEMGKTSYLEYLKRIGRVKK